MKNENSILPKQSKIFGLTPHEFCQAISLAIVGVGLIFLTKIYKLCGPFVTLIAAHPHATVLIAGLLLGIALITFIIRKYPISRHFLLYIAFFLITIAGINGISIVPRDSGQPFVTIWAPIVMQIGVLAFIFCVARHQKMKIQGITQLVFRYQGLFMLVLYGVGLTYAGVEVAERWGVGYHEATARFKSLHPDQTTWPGETIEANGIKFRCHMLNDIVDCR